MVLNKLEEKEQGCRSCAVEDDRGRDRRRQQKKAVEEEVTEEGGKRI